MNLKLRFAFLFTTFVAIILLVSSIAVYVLYYNFRLQDFYRRVQQQAITIYETYHEDPVTDTVELRMKTNKYALMMQEVMLLDSAGRILYKEPDTISSTFKKQVLDRVKRYQEYRFRIDNREVVGLYMEDRKEYIFCSAFDKYGLRKLNNTKLILIFVFFGGLLLTAFISFFFVRQAFRPLRRLSEQMLKTNELNMGEHVFEGYGNDEIQQIARSYNAMIDRLKKAFDLQKSFVRHASHELRTPLASMLSQTEAAFHKKLDESGYKKTLVSLKEDQQDMIELTNSLLLLSQYERLSFSNEWNVNRVDEVLYDTIKAIKKIFPQVIVTVEFDSMPDPEDLTLKSNEVLLRSAIRNLIKNAYLYSDDKSVAVYLVADKEKVQLHFDSKGKHIPVSERDRLFIPFFRGENAIHKKGHGLGLAIVYRILDVHNGSIVYTPVKENINRFTLTFYK